MPIPWSRFAAVFQLALAQRLTLRLKVPDRFPLLALGERSNLRCAGHPVPALAPQTEQWTGSLDFAEDRQLRAKTPLAARSC